MVNNHTRVSILEDFCKGSLTIIITDRNFTYTLEDNARNTCSKVPLSHLKPISKLLKKNPIISTSFTQQDLPILGKPQKTSTTDKLYVTTGKMLHAPKATVHTTTLRRLFALPRIRSIPKKVM